MLDKKFESRDAKLVDSIAKMLEESTAPKAVAYANEDKGVYRMEATRDGKIDEL